MKVPTTATTVTTLFTAGISAANLLVAHFTGAILSLQFTPQNTLNIIGNVTGDISMPAWLTLAPGPRGTRKLYAGDESNETGFGVVAAYDVTVDGQLENVVIAPAPGGVVHNVPYGEGYLASARYIAGSIFTQKLPLTPSSSVLQSFNYTMAIPGPNSKRQASPHPHSTFLDPTGRYLLSADLGADRIHIFKINPHTGYLTECPPVHTFSGAGPRHAAWWTPMVDGNGASGAMINETAKGLFVVNELNNSVTRYRYEYAKHGCLNLTAEQTIATYPEGHTGKTGSKSAAIQIFENHIYVSNRYDETFGTNTDSMAHFKVDAATGRLQFVEITSAYGSCPRTFVIHPEGHLVAIAGQTSSNLAIVERNTTTGKFEELLINEDILMSGDYDTETGLGAVLWV